MFTVYILFSESLNKFYTGQTQDLPRRLLEHNAGKTPFMAAGTPWIIVYTKNVTSRSEAVRLEKFIKKRGAKRFLDDNNHA